MAGYGYAGKILRVDLSSGRISQTPTSDYSDRFLGGRGLAAKIYWDEVSPEVGAFDPENRVIFATGPFGGIPPIGGSRWTICGKSAVKDQFSYCNLGGRWGAELKFTGYDALVVHGRSEKPVYLFIDGEHVELKGASHIWGKDTVETRKILKVEHGNSSRIVAIGPAGENLAVMASFFADNDASGSGHLAASVGAKRLKAIVVKKGAGEQIPIAQPEKFKDLVDYYRSLKIAFPHFDWQQISRWSRDLVLDFRTIPDQEEMKSEPCYGCLAHCARRNYTATDGTMGKFLCHSAYFYQPLAEQYYGEWNDVPYQATRLCDTYGVDTKAIDKTIGWLLDHYEAGRLTEESTGLSLSQAGSLEFIEALVKKVCLREGIGDILAEGLAKASQQLVPGVNEPMKGAVILSEPGFFDPYGPRLYLTNAFIYAMEPRIAIQQLHEIGMIMARWRTWTVGLADYPTEAVLEVARKFWGSEVAADFTTYEGKAAAAIRLQDRQYAKESLILCDFLWPIFYLEFTDDHVGDPTLESKFLSAVIGKEIDEEGLRKYGERVFNLQRAILVREGHAGREFDKLDERCFTEPLQYDLSNPECVVLGKEGNITSRKGAVVDREKFEKMKDEYYELRGWDVATGLQTRKQLEELGLPEIADDLEKRGLLGGVIHTGLS